MSSSLGEIKFIRSGRIYFFRFDTTTDLSDRVIFKTLEDYNKALIEYDEVAELQSIEYDSNRDPFETDIKPLDLEPVEMATEYAGGSRWKGLACEKTMTIDYCCIGNDDDFDLQEQDGLPDWWLATD